MIDMACLVLGALWPAEFPIDFPSEVVVYAFLFLKK